MTENDGLPADPQLRDLIVTGEQLRLDLGSTGGDIVRSTEAALDPTLLEVKQVLAAVVAKAITMVQGPFPETTEEAHQQYLFLASLLQGVWVTDDLIFNGQYVKAASCLRQDLELLTRYLESRAGLKPKQTPPMQLAGALKKFYGELSKVTHATDLQLLESLIATNRSGERRMVSLMPRFSENAASGLYAMHVFILLEVARSMIVFLKGIYGPDDFAYVSEMWHRALQKLFDEGYMRPLADPASALDEEGQLPQ